MEDRIITFTASEIKDLTDGIVIAIKELDKYENGSDRQVSDRLEKLLDQKIRITR